MQINCGVIAVRVIHGLSQPHEQRHQQLRSLITVYMKRVPVGAVDDSTGANDAISHLACRQWRVKQGLRLFQSAVAQREHGQAALLIA